MSISYDFKGKTAVVTGGSKGIGAQILKEFKQAGAKTVNWDLSASQNVVSQQDGADISVSVDISDPTQIEDALKKTTDLVERIDILSHNAGFAGPTGPVVESDPDIWRKVLKVNLEGTYLTCRAISQHMLEYGTGRIVTMASLAGKEGTPNASAYSAAKAGVIGFTKALAKELALTDIRVNSVAPAAIETEILEQMSDEFVQTMINKSPMNRLGRIDEVAALVLWLCSDACTFNTGAVFDLSGGRATY